VVRAGRRDDHAKTARRRPRRGRDDDAGEFAVVKTEGRVEAGEIVSIKYLGDREGTKYDYPDFKIARKPPIHVETDIEADTSDFVPEEEKDGIPF
jgi:hypothetical protein